MAAALLFAFADLSTTLASAGFTVHYVSTTEFTTTQGAQRLRWRLVADTDLRPVAALQAYSHVTWSGLVWPQAGAHLPPAVARHMSTSFLRSIESWLASDSILRRWDLIQTFGPAPPASPAFPGPTPPPATLLTLLSILRWALGTPASSVHGPWSSWVGQLRPEASDSRPPIPLYCDTQPPEPASAYLSLLSQPPAVVPESLVLVALPIGISIVTPVGFFPTAARRTLDLLFPPPAAYRTVDVSADLPSADDTVDTLDFATGSSTSGAPSSLQSGSASDAPALEL